MLCFFEPADTETFTQAPQPNPPTSSDSSYIHPRLSALKVFCSGACAPQYALPRPISDGPWVAQAGTKIDQVLAAETSASLSPHFLTPSAPRWQVAFVVA
jgi:hypothetical protein